MQYNTPTKFFSAILQDLETDLSPDYFRKGCFELSFRPLCPQQTG